MTLNGAGNGTYEAVRNTLGLESLSLEEINLSYLSIMQELTKIDTEVTFQIANSIWYKNDLNFKEQFINTDKYYFNAQVTGLNFSDPTSAAVMNQWVDENTNGKIKEIIEPPIDKNAVMFLINAIYFKGTWKYQFDPNYTTDFNFILEDGSTKLCEMMNQKSKLPYLSNELFQAVDLPYGNGKFRMTILLPTSNKTTDDIINEITPDKYQNWLNSFSEIELGLLLPKFTLDYDLTLNDALKQLGMEIAFTSNADFTAMYEPGGISISEVKHKTYVKVDEEGTEAAGVTSVGVVTGSGYGSNEIIMLVNRPFLVIIRETDLNVILFIGKIIDPSNSD